MKAAQERAAMAAAGLAPVPFTRTAPADVAGCEGYTSRIANRVAPLCHTCERYGHNSRSYVAPALVIASGQASCENFRPLLSADQVAAMDEMAGHVRTVRPATDSAPCLTVGGGVSATTPKGGV